MRGLNRGIELGQQFSKRTPAQACNTAGYYIALTTLNNTPAVSAEKINTELAVDTQAKIGARGKPLKNKKAFFGKVGTSATSAVIPLAVLIIAARSRPGSRYNEITNNRYAAPWQFKGVSRKAGAIAMRNAVHDLIANRRKSGSFIKSGWIPAVKGLNPYVGSSAHRDLAKWFLGSPSMAGNSDDKGYFKPATPGPVAQTVIANDLGGRGQNSESVDKALQRTAPILQAAVDNEGAKAMQYYLDHEAAQLAKEFNAITA